MHKFGKNTIYLCIYQKNPLLFNPLLLIKGIQNYRFFSHFFPALVLVQSNMPTAITATPVIVNNIASITIFLKFYCPLLLLHMSQSSRHKIETPTSMRNQLVQIGQLYLLRLLLWKSTYSYRKSICQEFHEQFSPFLYLLSVSYSTLNNKVITCFAY